MEHAAIKIPRGLADPHGEFAFVRGPQGLIYRLDIKSGETLARTNNPGLPLAIYADQLIGWALAPGSNSALRLFAVVMQGNILSLIWEQLLTLPAWVELDSFESDWFTLQAEFQDEKLLVTWSAQSRYAGGAPPPPGLEVTETRIASKVVHIDPKTGIVLSEEERALTPITGRLFPAMAQNWRVVPYLCGEAWATQPWSIDSEEAFLIKINGEPGILLVRRESASAAEPVVLRLTEDPTAIASVTPGGELVFILEGEDDAPTWVVYSVKTGQRLSMLPYDSGTQGVAVVKEQVLYLVTQEFGPTRRSSLRCRDMQTGKLMWSFTLEEETISMAPPPPP